MKSTRTEIFEQLDEIIKKKGKMKKSELIKARRLVRLCKENTQKELEKFFLIEHALDTEIKKY